jgi:AAA15 family ATPase/GTPase
MKIKALYLKNFKRFSELNIEDIPVDNKLVLLIGSNGSGKSSVFDAFGYIDNIIKCDVNVNQEFYKYYKKNANEQMSIKLCMNDSEIILTDKLLTTPNNIKDLNTNSFYGRTSFRQISKLTRISLGQGDSLEIQKDNDRPKNFIERDIRFENDVEKITAEILKDFFRNNENNKIKETIIDPINKALHNVFNHKNGTSLQLIEIIPPLEGKVAQITFKKGKSEFHYNLLSAGEKEVINLFINLLSRREYYQDTIYFLDEIDLHLNTSIQFNLLKELCENWIPENSQIWTASHSLGFIEYARQTQNACIIDFDDLDFDVPRTLRPVPKENAEIYEIAVSKEFLPSIFQHLNVYFVENKDSVHYAQINLPHTIFIPETNRNGVYHKVKEKNLEYKGIVDRDFLSDDDIEKIQENYPNLKILKFYSIENYLYHPENLHSFYEEKGRKYNSDAYILGLVKAKNIVINDIITSIELKRTEYPYFKEPDWNDKKLQERFKNKEENSIQSRIVFEYLKSDDYAIFLKSFSLKKYATDMPERQNISKTELSKTPWFIKTFKNILTN